MHQIQKHGRRILAAAVMVANISAAQAQAAADGISDWMDVAKSKNAPWTERTRENARAEAIVALAMFEAANAVEGEYPSFLGVSLSADADNSNDASLRAANAAAEHALRLLYPASANEAGPADKTDSVAALGRQAAEAAIARGAQLSDRPVSPFRTQAPAGVYIPEEAPNLVRDFDLSYAPWTLTSVDEFRSGPTPALTSKRYAKDLEEVRKLGAKEGSTRTPRQSETARFWFLIDMNHILREIAERPGRTPAQNARLYAMFYMATDDSWAAAVDAKSHHQFWRPITAIRQADRDGNADTSPDPFWRPFMPTPGHPEYPCAHCVQAAAQAVVIAAELENPKEAFVFRSSTLPDATPREGPLDLYVDETLMSRIYAGAHYRFSNEAGEKLGDAIGARVVERWRGDEE